MVRRGEIVVLCFSVVVKWFSKEARSDEAIKLMNSHVDESIGVSVLGLSLCEVADALRYKPDYDAEKLRSVVTPLLKLHLYLTPLDESLLGRAGGIAYDGDVTLYDAIPVALAECQKTVCMTADEETQYGRLWQKGYPIRLL